MFFKKKKKTCKDNRQDLCLHYHTMKSPAVSKASGMWNHYINVYWRISIQIKAKASKQLVKHNFQKKVLLVLSCG